jgi:signal transduction histidine kinase
MRSLLFNIIDRFIPDKLKDDPYLLRKGRVLTYTHITLMFIAIFLAGARLIVDLNDPVPMFPLLLAALLCMALFKWKGNFVLSGNLIAAGMIAPVIYYVPQTGGLNSDNLLWLFLAPITGLLLASRISGIVWLAFLLVYTSFLYVNYENFRPNYDFYINHPNAPFYYYYSFSFLFITFFVIIHLFESGQQLIIKTLREQKAVLRQQTEEISAKNTELQIADEKLKQTVAELENFAFAASHDLKEPLRMIGMYVQLLEKRSRGQISESNLEYMSYITEGVARMQTLLNDLLQYSRLGKQQDDIRDVDLNNTLFLVVHNLAVAMKDANASVIAPTLPVVRASSVEMNQLFQNLIANAIKFRKKGEKPNIEIGITETATDEYLFSFADNGIGIPPQYRERVFNIFERLHGRQDYEGSGIGLATCKKIVTNSGGKIWLNSTEGTGTTFYFTLPKAQQN